MKTHGFEPLPDYRTYPEGEMQQRAIDFHRHVQRRRTVRDFSDREVPLEVIENCIRSAATAPSGANRQPWHFAVISDPEVKKKIRIGAEKEESDFYGWRAPEDWLEALEPFATDEHKPFLEIAPYLIVIFAQMHGQDDEGEKVKHYYVNESVGIATGILITALHDAGLATLTHTPSPMRFLNDLLDRPRYERPFLVLVAGHPSETAQVPKISKKTLEEVASFF
jgi:iodotyrosine deiodinase